MRYVGFRQIDLETGKSFSLSPLVSFFFHTLYLNEVRLDLKIEPPELRRPALKLEEICGGGELKWRWSPVVAVVMFTGGNKDEEWERRVAA